MDSTASKIREAQRQITAIARAHGIALVLDLLADHCANEAGREPSGSAKAEALVDASIAIEEFAAKDARLRGALRRADS